MSLWKQIQQLLIDFFNRLAQVQTPDGDESLTCPLRRLPQIANTQPKRCKQNYKY